MEAISYFLYLHGEDPWTSVINGFAGAAEESRTRRRVSQLEGQAWVSQHAFCAKSLLDWYLVMHVLLLHSNGNLRSMNGGPLKEE